MTRKYIYVVPLSSPNADSIEIEVPVSVDFSGRFSDAVDNCAQWIPADHFMVKLDTRDAAAVEAEKAAAEFRAAQAKLHLALVEFYNPGERDAKAN